MSVKIKKSMLLTVFLVTCIMFLISGAGGFEVLIAQEIESELTDKYEEGALKSETFTNEMKGKLEAEFSSEKDNKELISFTNLKDNEIEVEFYREEVTGLAGLFGKGKPGKKSKISSIKDRKPNHLVAQIGGGYFFSVGYGIDDLLWGNSESIIMLGMTEGYYADIFAESDWGGNPELLQSGPCFAIMPKLNMYLSGSKSSKVRLYAGGVLNLTKGLESDAASFSIGLNAGGKFNLSGVISLYGEITPYITLAGSDNETVASVKIAIGSAFYIF